MVSELSYDALLPARNTEFWLKITVGKEETADAKNHTKIFKQNNSRQTRKKRNRTWKIEAKNNTIKSTERHAVKALSMMLYSSFCNLVFGRKHNGTLGFF